MCCSIGADAAHTTKTQTSCLEALRWMDANRIGLTALLLRKVIRPAAVRAEIAAHIGWHTFRRSLATLLQSNAESVNVTQDMMRHATSRMTMDVYAQSIPADRRAAQKTVVDAVLKGQLFPRSNGQSSQVVEKMVGTWGLEPQTSTVSR